MTIKVNAMGDACPIPVVKTQKAMQELGGAGTVKTLVDNETAVQNLGKLAASKGCTSKTEKLGENEYRVTITVGENAKVEEQSGECYTCGKPKTVVVLSSDKMGSGNDELGGALMKAFVFALSQQETLPDTILCYNGGVKLTCEGSESRRPQGHGRARRGDHELRHVPQLLRPQGKARRRRGDEYVRHRRKDERRGPRRPSVR